MTKPIYILITPLFPSDWMWEGSYAYDFVRALMATGLFDVRVYQTTRRQRPDYEYRGIKVRTFSCFVPPSGVLSQLFIPLNRRIFLRRMAQDGLDMAKVAVVDGFFIDDTIYAMAAKAINPRIIAVTHHHDCGSFGIFNGRLRYFYPLKLWNFFWARWLRQKPDLHVFISDLVKRSFLAFPDTSWSANPDYRRISRGLGFLSGVKVAERACYVMHNGVDTRQFNRSVPSRAASRPDDGEFVIGCVANFDKGKGHLTLLEAVKMLVESGFPGGLRCRVVFVGNGDTKRKCRKFARESGLDVEFRDEVDHTLLPDFYRSLDLYVMPSYWEGFGCVYTEAWACGTPFIACRGSAMEEVLSPDETDYWLCRPMDAADLAEKIRGYALTRREQRICAEIDIEKLVAKYAEHVSNMLGGVV